MVDVKIYVEGGGDQANLKTKCRKGFRIFLEKILPKEKKSKIIACGSRQDAFNRFCTAVSLNEENTFCILLVDSEGPVPDNMTRWLYLKDRPGDGWDMPENVDENNVHFMVQCMESWFMADKNCLAEFFGQGFNVNALPKNPDIEKIPKMDVFNGLKNATRNTKTKGKYGKGNHSFEILSRIDPVKVCGSSKHANILIDIISVK